MGRILALLYGVAVYLFFFVTFLYAILFVGNLWVPKTIDSGAEPFSIQALIINLLLLGVFALQHSIMARPVFKRAWTRIVPEPVERSTYVLFSSLALALLFWQWRGISGVVWQVESTAGTTVIWAVFLLGWAILFAATFMIDHFDLFGLRQVYLYATGKAYPDPELQFRGFYRYIRHPIMTGFIIGSWATPVMTYGHLLFAVGITGYILISVPFFEEKDLADALGEPYSRYRRSIPMFFPLPGKTASKRTSE